MSTADDRFISLLQEHLAPVVTEAIPGGGSRTIFKPKPVNNNPQIKPPTMKLKEFTPENCLSNTGGRATANRVPTLNIGKAGCFAFSTNAAKLLDLRTGEFITIVQDQDDEEIFYVANNGTSGKGFALKLQKNGTLTFSNSALAKILREAFHGEGFKANCKARIAGQATVHEGRKLYGLLPVPIV